MADLGLLGALQGLGQGVADVGKMTMADRIAQNRAAALQKYQTAREERGYAVAEGRQAKSLASAERIAAQAEEGSMKRAEITTKAKTGASKTKAKTTKADKLASEISKVEDQLAKLEDSSAMGEEKPAETNRAKAKLASLRQQLRLLNPPTKGSGKFTSLYADIQEPELAAEPTPTVGQPVLPQPLLQPRTDLEPYNVLP